MKYCYCGMCGEKTVSMVSVISASHFRPHICSNCGRESYIHSGRKLWFLFVFSFFLWVGIFTILIIDAPMWMGLIVAFFSLFSAFRVSLFKSDYRIYKG